MNDCTLASGESAGLYIPSGPAAITPEWMTKALRSTGIITKSRVTSLDSKIIGQGKGFTGPVARIKLAYDIDEPNAPKSLVAKFPVANAKLRTILNFSRLFEREIRFYKELAERIELRTPVCYYSALDAEEVESILLLEDLGDSQVSSNVRHWSLKNTHLAIEQLAKFHATWWNSPQLDEITWMPTVVDDACSLQELFRKLWRLYIKDISDEMSVTYIKIGEQLQDNVVKICEHLGVPPQTITHGDYRPRNLFFSSGPDGASFAVVDWQVAMRGRGLLDVAYFLVSFPASYRRANEMRILKSYHSVLEKSGICGYHLDECMLDYKYSILSVLIRLIAVQGSFLNLSSVGGRALYKARLHRCILAVKDHNITELVR